MMEQAKVTRVLDRWTGMDAKVSEMGENRDDLRRMHQWE